MSNQPVTVILPFDLGAVANYEQRVFPLAYHDAHDSNIGKGSLLLAATLDEIKKIKEMGIDLADSGEFLFNTRMKYEALAAKKEKLQKKRKTYNPVKRFLYYRAGRMFHAASSALFLRTKATSERMQRDHSLQSVPSVEIRAANQDDAPADALITGIAITLPGALDDDAKQAISDATDTIVSHASQSFVEGPFLSQWDKEGEDQWIQSLADTDAESLLSLMPESSFPPDESDETPNTSTIGLSSPQSITIHVTGDFYNNSILSTNSNVTAPTINNGSGNTGASVSLDQ